MCLTGSLLGIALNCLNISLEDCYHMSDIVLEMKYFVGVC